jgi:hypothetical protein
LLCRAEILANSFFVHLLLIVTEICSIAGWAGSFNPLGYQRKIVDTLRQKKRKKLDTDQARTITHARKEAV